MKWAVFVSGTGSNMTALIDAMESWQVSLVVCNRKASVGAKRARRRGLPVWYIGKEIDWENLSQRLQAAGIQSIVLAGFMKILPEEFLRSWNKPVINLHPSLLPAYPGVESIRRSFEEGARMGVTVHEVIAQVDAGPILLQKESKRASTLEDSEFRLHVLEQRLLQKGVGKCDHASFL